MCGSASIDQAVIWGGEWVGRGMSVLEGGHLPQGKRGFCGGVSTHWSQWRILNTHTRRACASILTIYASYDLFPRKDVFLRGSVAISLHLRG